MVGSCSPWGGGVLWQRVEGAPCIRYLGMVCVQVAPSEENVAKQPRRSRLAMAACAGNHEANHGVKWHGIAGQVQRNPGVRGNGVLSNSQRSRVNVGVGPVATANMAQKAWYAAR